MLRYCNGFSRSNSFGAAGDDCGRCAGTAAAATVSASTTRRTKLMRDALNVLNIRMGSFTLSLEKEGLRLGIISFLCVSVSLWLSTAEAERHREEERDAHRNSERDTPVRGEVDGGRKTGRVRRRVDRHSRRSRLGGSR